MVCIGENSCLSMHDSVVVCSNYRSFTADESKWNGSTWIGEQWLLWFPVDMGFHCHLAQRFY